MSAPSLNDEDGTSSQIAMFDSYSKTVMRNACRNVVKAKKRLQDKEMVGTEEMLYLFMDKKVEDNYPSEHLQWSDKEQVCAVISEWLYEAIERLPQNQKEVLILEYWYELKASDISAMLNIPRRTLYAWRKKAIQAIKQYEDERNTKWQN